MKRIYFDTEFCDLWNPTPISIGFAADSGEELYLELEHDSNLRSAWVQQFVVPLLEGAPITPDEAVSKIAAFLHRLGAPQIELVCDFVGDFWILRNLFIQSLGPGSIVIFGTPSHCNVPTAVAGYYLKEQGLPQHHALNDARALRAIKGM